MRTTKETPKSIARIRQHSSKSTNQLSITGSVLRIRTRNNALVHVRAHSAAKSQRLQGPPSRSRIVTFVRAHISPKHLPIAMAENLRPVRARRSILSFFIGIIMTDASGLSKRSGPAQIFASVGHASPDFFGLCYDFASTCGIHSPKSITLLLLR